MSVSILPVRLASPSVHQATPGSPVPQRSYANLDEPESCRSPKPAPDPIPGFVNFSMASG